MYDRCAPICMSETKYDQVVLYRILRILSHRILSYRILYISIIYNSIVQYRIFSYLIVLNCINYECGLPLKHWLVVHSMLFNEGLFTRNKVTFNSYIIRVHKQTNIHFCIIDNQIFRQYLFNYNVYCTNELVVFCTTSKACAANMSPTRKVLYNKQCWSWSFKQILYSQYQGSSFLVYILQYFRS